MNIYKPKEFAREMPVASVILPILNGEKSLHFLRHIKDLSAQSYQDFELIVVAGVSPNGRARNEGYKCAKGKYLIFIDETMTLGNCDVLRSLMEVMRSTPNIGMAGTGVTVNPQMNFVSKQYAFIRGFENPIADRLTDSWHVSHACMCVPKAVFEAVHGESNNLITGTDNDLRQRVHQARYRMVLVPNTWVQYQVEGSYWKLLKKSYLKGQGSVYAFLKFPGLFENRVNHRCFAPIYKIIAAVSKILCPVYWVRPLSLTFEWAVAAGYVAGWFKWIREKPYEGRPDLL